MYVLDPGHPNHSLNPDSKGYGAVYDGEGARLEERQLNYDICNKIQDMAKNYGVRVELTHDKDEPATLNQRCQLERDLQPECFVSVHHNFFGSPEPRGSTIFHYGDSDEGQRLSESLDPYFQGYVTIPHRRMRMTDSKRDDDLTPYFYVLSNTNSTAVLLELAFLSSPADRKQILHDRSRYVWEYARVIFGGLQYFSHTKGET